jgi:hypothetical protein
MRYKGTLEIKVYEKQSTRDSKVHEKQICMRYKST